jgi:hypothetical protein
VLGLPREVAARHPVGVALDRRRVSGVRAALDHRPTGVAGLVLAATRREGRQGGPRRKGRPATHDPNATATPGGRHAGADRRQLGHHRRLVGDAEGLVALVLSGLGTGPAAGTPALLAA